MQTAGGRAFQAEGTASAKALRRSGKRPRGNLRGSGEIVKGLAEATKVRTLLWLRVRRRP